ncbi:amino acid ABC transporter permease [Pseudomonas koreensis]|uniref:amino acid ABC transporter permease n=1 Tax=Pseudomonas koreensis TaxID=198620 RepID=UPI003208831B
MDEIEHYRMHYGDIVSIAWQLSQGVIYTVFVTLTCFVTGMSIGLAATVLRRLALPGIDFFLDSFTFIFRGIPILVLVFLVYFGLPGFGINIHPVVAMNLSLGLITGAYLAEVFRGALKSVDSTELLAAEAMGMSRMQVFFYVEFPQMLRFAFPGMVNEFTSVLKNSAFAYTIGISEITRQALAITSTTNFGVEVYVIVGLLYFLIYRVFLFSMKRIERRFVFSAEALN